MNRALGLAGLVLGLSSALIGTASIAYALATRTYSRLRIAQQYAVLVLVGAVLSVVAMERALITRDFTVGFVAEHGSSKTPPLFNVATLWSALEGSILLWALILAGYLVATVFKFRHRLTDPLVGWAVLTQMVVAVFFFAMMLLAANPFTSFDPPLGYDGPGPNPLLQNHPLMAFHPPMLYLGYVGFTVPFSFAIAALVTGRLGEGWLIATRRWTMAAWGFLTVGIVAGAWWAYAVLGWAGYWGWDPVENASFLPWLTGTAFVHSVMVQERRAMLRVWNLSLVCATFSLTILGTFLTRSGVVTSVHAFADGAVGPLLLGFFALIVAVSVGLIGWRGDLLRSPGRVDSPLSREGAFMLNNLGFAAFAFVVLLGTVFPLIVEAVQGRQIAVGAQYFNNMTMPVALVLLFLMSVAPVLPWRKAAAETLRARLLWPAWIGVGALAVAVFVGARGVTPLIAYFLSGFAGGSALRQLGLATRRQGWRGLVGRTNGGMIVHLGVVLLAVGYTSSAAFVQDAEFRMAVGDTVTVGDHEVTFLGVETIDRPEKESTLANLQLDGGAVYRPSLNRFKAAGQVIGEPSIRPSVIEDVYMTLVAPPGGDGRATIRILVEPLVSWIWIGGAVMGLGTVAALVSPKRRNSLGARPEPIEAGRTLEEPAEDGADRVPDSSPIGTPIAVRFEAG